MLERRGVSPDNQVGGTRKPPIADSRVCLSWSWRMPVLAVATATASHRATLSRRVGDRGLRGCVLSEKRQQGGWLRNVRARATGQFGGAEGRELQG